MTPRLSSFPATALPNLIQVQPHVMPLFSWQNRVSDAGTCCSHVAGAKVVCPSSRTAAWALQEQSSRELDSGHGLEAEQQVAA